uniref:Noelin domain-containing protein n=1 Tax=Ciona savignyi TaxID=51511 RepID=H2Z6M0_CIOSA
MASPALNFAFVCAIVVMRTSTANSKHHEQLQTISEGSDCKCRCVMRMEDGGPCPYNPNTRRTLYYVDTVSGGSDCRCSCLSPAPPKDCEPENPSGAGTSQGNTEGREPVISIPISDDGQGNRVSVTISGTSDASRALDRAAQAGNLEEILSRAVTGMNVIKMHSSVTKMVLAMLDLEQILSTNFTEETQILRRNMGKVAKRLEKSEEYGEVRQLVEEEIQRMDGSPNEQNNETLSNQTETTMASVETVDSTNY